MSIFKRLFSLIVLILPAQNIAQNLCGPIEQYNLSKLRQEYHKEFIQDQIIIKAKIHSQILESTTLQQSIWNELAKNGYDLPDEKNLKCQNFLCWLSSILNNEEAALRIMLIAKNENIFLQLKAINAPSEAQIIWKAHEVKNIQDQLKILPIEFKNSVKKSLRYLQRSSAAITSINPLSFNYSVMAFSNHQQNNGYIKLYDASFGDGLKSIKITLVHEMAHHFDQKYFNSSRRYFFESSGFINLSSWKLTDKEYIIIDNNRVLIQNYDFDPLNQFVSSYASSQPGEDFAESVAFYFEHPLYFKKVAPKKYEFIKQYVFSGKEFIFPRQSQWLSTENFMNELNQLSSECRSYMSLNYSYQNAQCLEKIISSYLDKDPFLCEIGENEIRYEYWRHLIFSN